MNFCNPKPLLYIPIVGVRRRVIITKGSDDIRQFTVLPADKDVASPGVAINNTLHTVRVVTLTRCVNGKSKAFCQRKNRVVWALLRAIWAELVICSVTHGFCSSFLTHMESRNSNI